MDVSETPPARARARAYAPAWLALLAGLAASAALAWWFWAEAAKVDTARFHTGVTNLVEHLDTRTERYVLELERFTDLLASQPGITDLTWRECLIRFTPESKLPALVELACATNTDFKDRAWIEVEQQRETNELGQARHPLRLRVPPLLEVTRHWASHPGLAAIETENWLNQPDIGECWLGTVNGRMTASPRRMAPAAGSARQAAVSLFIPVFAPDFAQLSERHNPKHIWGLRSRRFQALVVGTLGWQEFLETALPGETGLIAFEAFAGEAPTAENWMGTDGRAPSQVLAPHFRPRFQHTQSWPFFRQRWQLVFYSTALFEQQSPRYRAWVALGGGGVLSILVAGLLGVQVRARRRQEFIAGQLRVALDELGMARKERERLSHDLHDGTIQSLYALQLGLSRAAEQARAEVPAVGQRLAEYRRNLTGVIGELRGFILRHEAEPGPAGDLVSVLTALVERLRYSTETVLRAELDPGAARRLTGEQAVHLANLAREALSNTLRHAHASEAILRLSVEGEAVRLEINDNGLGFDPADAPGTGFGLASMALRAREAGGELNIESAAGNGTRLRVKVPVPRSP